MYCLKSHLNLPFGPPPCPQQGEDGAFGKELQLGSMSSFTWCWQLRNSGFLPPPALCLQAPTAGSEPKGLFKCCLFFRPINGGQDCPGVNFEYQLCNTDECPKHFEDFRAQQCQQRNSHFEYQNTKHHWMPYEHPDCE